MTQFRPQFNGNQGFPQGQSQGPQIPQVPRIPNPQFQPPFQQNFPAQNQPIYNAQNQNPSLGNPGNFPIQPPQVNAPASNIALTHSSSNGMLNQVPQAAPSKRRQLYPQQIIEQSQPVQNFNSPTNFQQNGIQPIQPPSYTTPQQPPSFNQGNQLQPAENIPRFTSEGDLAGISSNLQNMSLSNQVR
jgi:hypothetical protein